MRVKYVAIDSCYQCKNMSPLNCDCGQPITEGKRKAVLKVRELEKYEYKGKSDIPEWCPLPDAAATTITQEK